jgi:hypothetical protein
MHATYTSDELKFLVRILNDILSEARICRPDLSRDDIAQRVFTLADRGERDVRKLHRAVFGAAPLRRETTASHREEKLNLGEFQKIARAPSATRGSPPV